MAELYIWIGDDDGSSDNGICHIILGTKQGLKRIRIRIDRPKHFQNQSTVKQAQHGHVEERRGGDWVQVQVLNPDGSGSHATVSGDAIRSDVADVLRSQGWDISEDNVVRMVPEAVNRLILAALELVQPTITHFTIEILISVGVAE